METALLVDGINNSGFVALLRSKRSSKIELEPFSNDVVELDLVAKNVRGGPGLSEGQTVDLVDPLALKVTSNGVGLGITSSLDLEGHVGRCLGLDLERGALIVVVLGQQIVRGLAKVL